jgi:hypothetical protein
MGKIYKNPRKVIPIGSCTPKLLINDVKYIWKSKEPKNLDLLEAQESVDWAASRLHGFSHRLNCWMKANLVIGLETTDEASENNVLVIHEKNFFPMKFNVEAGLYINAFRTSLDLLASTLARRVAFLEERKVYFPIAKNSKHFEDRQFAGSEFFKSLPQSYQDALGSLEPYCGGKYNIWEIHEFDILRKHRRLITIQFGSGYSIEGWGLRTTFTPITSIYASGSTIFGVIKKNSSITRLECSPHVALCESDIGPKQQLIPTLYNFAKNITEIISIIDKL